MDYFYSELGGRPFKYNGPMAFPVEPSQAGSCSLRSDKALRIVKQVCSQKSVDYIKTL